MLIVARLGVATGVGGWAALGLGDRLGGGGAKEYDSTYSVVKIGPESLRTYGRTEGRFRFFIFVFIPFQSSILHTLLQPSHQIPMIPRTTGFRIAHWVPIRYHTEETANSVAAEDLRLNHESRRLSENAPPARK